MNKRLNAGTIDSSLLMENLGQCNLPILLLMLVSWFALSYVAEANGWSSMMNPVSRQNGICVELVRPHGYQCEELMIQTADGYLLGMQRVHRDVTKGPVVLYHGIDNGGDIWLLNPPSQSLAFMLADAGHEVWIPSTRCSTFSYGHVSLNSSDKAYWDWSLDELGNYDLPSVVGEVSARSQKKILFVAYSQASQALFAALSQGQMAGFIEKAVMLAPVAYCAHTSSPIATVATQLNLGLVALRLNIYEFNPRANSGSKLLEVLCVTANVCETDMLSLITGPNCCVDSSRLDFINRYELQATSIKNWNHLGQMYQKQSFSKFDYGEKENLRRYGSKVAPNYDLSKVPTEIPMMLIHGGKDALSDPEDVYRLLAELKKPPALVFLPHYAHFDFVLGTNARKDVYQGIMSFFDA